MPLTAAEKQRRYRERINADPERRQQHLQKERKRWHDNKSKGGSRVAVADLSDREKRVKRRYWRQKQRFHRGLMKAQNAEHAFQTPPTSPDEVPRPRRFGGERIRRRNKAKCYRDIKKLEMALAEERKKVEKFKKRYQRLRTTLEDSPRTKTRTLLKNYRVDKKVRKTLLYHYSLTSDLRAKYKATKGERQKQAFGRVLCGKIVKRYRMQKLTQETFGFSQRRWARFIKDEAYEDLLNFHKQRKSATAVTALQRSVQAFYTRDDVSRSTSGKKETITRQKTKKQKRFLCDTLKVLHLKFLSENPHINISYSLFCRLRPFWVLIPTIKDRDTCQCKIHENTSFMAQKLKDLKLLPTSDISVLADTTACDINSKDCMYGKCQVCCDKVFVIEPTYNGSLQVEYWQWVSKKTERSTKNGETTEQRVTTKVKITDRLLDLVEDFQENLKKFRRHIFNIRHQFTALRSLKEKMGENECVIQVDFAENYRCSYSSEIQAVHFGGSHQQVTLHDVVVHVGGVQDPIPFCTISPSTQHDPPAIWEHLNPVLEFIKNTYPQVDTLHFYSDGPSTQYRQKKNFFLFSTKVFDFGFLKATWSFFEAGHGKGSPDGIGGAIKRSADRLVSNGRDLPDALAVFTALSEVESSVKLSYIDVSRIQHATEALPDNLPAVPGTMNIHQVLTTKRRSIKYRDISCFCKVPRGVECQCYSAMDFSFLLPTEHDAGPSKSDAVESSPSSQFDGLTPLDVSDPHLVGKWCVIVYDGSHFPGLVMDVDEEDVEVKCMARVGQNRFFWPMIEDRIWYSHECIICMIPEPQRVGTRHVEIDKAIWVKLSSRF